MAGVPEDMKDKYGNTKVVRMARRLDISPQKHSSTLPIHLQLKRRKKEDHGISILDENCIYERCKDKIIEMVEGGDLYPKSKKITRIMVFTQYLKGTGIVKRYTTQQIIAKLTQWIKLEKMERKASS